MRKIELRPASLFPIVLLAMLAGAFIFTPIRAIADGWYGDFVRDANYYLDVNCKIGCGSTSQAGPGYSRIEDGTSTNLAAVNSSGQLSTLSAQSGTWNVGLNAGSNTIGSIANTAFGISGSLPAGTNVIGGMNMFDGANEALVDSSGNQYFTLCKGGSTTCANVMGSSTDAETPGANLVTQAVPMIYNGTNFDRLRECGLTGYACVVPAQANSTSAAAPNVNCDKTVTANLGAIATLITHSGTTNIYICSIFWSAVGTATAGLANITTGTGTTCGTGNAIVNQINVPGSASAGVDTNLVMTHGYMKIASSTDVCGAAASLGNTTVLISYAQTANGP